MRPSSKSCSRDMDAAAWDRPADLAISEMVCLGCLLRLRQISWSSLEIVSKSNGENVVIRNSRLEEQRPLIHLLFGFGFFLPADGRRDVIQPVGSQASPKVA